MNFREIELQDHLDIQWGDTTKTKSSYVESGYLAFSASGPDGFLDSFDYDQAGVILSAIGANCGKTYYATGQWSCIKNTIRILPKSSDLDLKFFYYLTKQKDFWPLRGSAQPFISQTDIREMHISVPDISTQKLVGDLLYMLDQKIQTNSLIAKTLELISQTIFSSWFVNFEPVKAKASKEQPFGMNDETARLFADSMQESELGFIPLGWKVESLSNLLTIHKKVVKPSEQTASLPYVPIDQISPRTVFLHNSLPGQLAQTSLVSFDKMDILFGAMRPYFHKVALAPFSGTTRTTTFILKPKISESLCFSLFTVFQDRAIEYATSHSQGTTMPYAVWANGFENYRYVQPPFELVVKFNDLVQPMLEYGQALLLENRLYAALRDLMLPRLLSGELHIQNNKLEP